MPEYARTKLYRVLGLMKENDLHLSSHCLGLFTDILKKENTEIICNHFNVCLHGDGKSFSNSFNK